MAAPHTIIPAMEGLVGTLSGVHAQGVSIWVDTMKAIMGSNSLRDSTTWVFVGSADVDESANNVLSGAGTLYGILFGTDSADTEIDFVVLTDATSNTLDGTAALDNTDIWVTALPAAATDGTRQYSGFAFPQGLAFATGITVGADGQDGTNPAANDIHAWLLYRT